MKHVAITDFLTDEEITRAQVLYEALQATGTFAATVAREIITPNLARINAALGQENDARYLAYMVEYVLTATTTQASEWAEDVCQVCGAHLGQGLRFLHVGLCEACATAPKH